MVTRIAFVLLALGIAGGVAWAYRHDAELASHAHEIQIGDPNQAVLELLGEPSSQGTCGQVSVAPSTCDEEYVYRYYYSFFQPQYEVVWFDARGNVIGGQHVQRAF